MLDVARAQRCCISFFRVEPPLWAALLWAGPLLPAGRQQGQAAAADHLEVRGAAGLLSSSLPSQSRPPARPPGPSACAQMLPGSSEEQAHAALAQLLSWLRAQPLSRRPLVKPDAKVAPEPAVRMLQASFACSVI